MKLYKAILLLSILFVGVVELSAQKKHPFLLINGNDVKLIKENYKKYSLFNKTFEDAKKTVDAAMLIPIDVPVPKDAAAYTHGTHKQNYSIMQLAGIMYQVTNDNKYADYIKAMLLKYAQLYPTLGKHPASTGESYGKLFWQSLNETVWLLNSIQAYDCIYEYLKADEREIIETNVFRKMAQFFMNEKSRDFNLIHNHGTWMIAAVGMTGFVLNDKDMIEKSLHGSNLDDKSGFLKQLKSLYSPDGYYTEGAYYARYAIQPFYLFAEAINNNMPELKIYEYHNQILKKALYSTLQMTNYNGDFLPFNDAIVGKNFLSPELVYSLNLAYKHYNKDSQLLDIAKRQNLVMLSSAGLSVAAAINKQKELPKFDYQSILLRDGGNGEDGGLAILREKESESLLFLKYTGHGLSHGHYDKLTFMFYNKGNPIIPDYGAARWVNIEPKYGGRYLPENKSFAMSTVAHNTLVVDQKSQFDGKITQSSKYHSNFHFASISNPNFQIVSAKENNAYSGVKIQRTIALLNDEKFTDPIVIDVVKAEGQENHQYDLPFYYYGHLMNTNIKYTSYQKEQRPLGESNGYEHLWKVAEGVAPNNSQITFLNQYKYYSITCSTDSTMKVYFTRIGANDPNFNLRNDAGIIFRKNSNNFSLATVIEPHGNYNEVTENTTGFSGVINEVEVLSCTNEATVVNIKGKDNLNWILLINNGAASDSSKHSVEVNGKKYEWIGNYSLLKN